MSFIVDNLKLRFSRFFSDNKTWVASFYFITTFIFVLWMLFFDTNNWIDQWRMFIKISDLKHEKVYYQTMIKELEQTKSSLLSDPELLERFAREKYMMKKDNEDVYILQKK